MKKLIFLLLFSANVLADSAIVSWSPPTTRADGTALPGSEIGGYHVFMNDTEILDTQQTTATISGLSVGTYIFQVTCYDTEGRESNFSNAVSRTVRAAPGAPGTLEIQIVP
ncbi:MAG: fibronectin type III domain-containing protein [bacterium]